MRLSKHALFTFWGLDLTRDHKVIKFAEYLLLVIVILTAGPVSGRCTTGAPITNVGMEYVDICDRDNSCKKFSRLVMGTDHLVQANWVAEGQQDITDDELYAILDEAIKLGINAFDTSPIYVGDIENKLGKWLDSRQMKIREKGFYGNVAMNPDRRLYTISKGGFPLDLFYWQKLESGTHSAEFMTLLHDQGILRPNSIILPDGSIPVKDAPIGTYSSRLYGSEDQIKNRVSEELRYTINHLKRNITIYLMHRDDADFFKFDEIIRPKTPVVTIMKALSANEIANQVWQIGWSNWQTQRIDESIKLAATQPQLLKPTINSPYFSLFEMANRSIHAGGVQVFHREMIDPKFQEGIKIMPYSPLGGFSILDKPEPRWDNAMASAKKKYEEGDSYWQNVFHAIFTEKNRNRYERVVQFTNEFNQKHSTNYTVDQMINAYTLAHHRTDLLAVGPITIPQLRRTVASLALSRLLTSDDLEYLYGGSVVQQQSNEKRISSAHQEELRTQ
jgi:aryl-alcohol dehydrogenase-like predicted oxidoreductase